MVLADAISLAALVATQVVMPFAVALVPLPKAAGLPPELSLPYRESKQGRPPVYFVQSVELWLLPLALRPPALHSLERSHRRFRFLALLAE